MTQTPPLDLEAIQQRYDLVEAGWIAYPLETGETEAEYRKRVEPCLSVDAYNSACDVPALIAEIRRLEGGNGWRPLVRQQIAELVAKDRLIGRLEEASAQQQVEIDHLRRPSAVATCTIPPAHAQLDADGFCEACGVPVA
jgi:hypothetical protein